MVQWAKENAAASGVADGAVRWIVDDCIKFVQREIRRGNRYDIVILDPPSYGRGQKVRSGDLEDNLYDFVTLVQQVLSDDALAVVLNSYTTGLSASVMQYILEDVLVRQMGGSVSADEIGLPVTETGGVLPAVPPLCGKAKMAILEFNDVTFTYPADPDAPKDAPASRPVLSHLNLQIEKGSFVAVLGHNGPANPH